MKTIKKYNHVRSSNMTFNELGIQPILIETLNKQGITSPTPVQQAVIPPFLEGTDLIVQAETGTGKSLAFLLPLIQSIDPETSTLQGLILAPTRELALQISTVAETLATVHNIQQLCLYGGGRVSTQLKKLTQPPQLIVATPGRLIDHLDRESIDLSNLRFFILDEADQLLLSGFKPEIEQIILKTPGYCQTLLASATLPTRIKKLAYRYTFNPRYISIHQTSEVTPSIHQEMVPTTDRQKFPALSIVLKEDHPYLAIIFCRTKRRANELYAKMKKLKFNADVIHSDIPQNKRERILGRFRKGDLQFLIATDVAARGLDINFVTHVYNFDIPEDTATYIHRIGRTGRAGETGYACTFVGENDGESLNAIEEKLNHPLERRVIKIGKK